MSHRLRLPNTKPTVLACVGACIVGSSAGCAEHAEAPPPQLPSHSPVIVRSIDLDGDEVGVTAIPTRRSAPLEFDDADADSVRLFHDVLAPYGEWTENARLGLVWVPKKDGVGPSFVPYATHGHWTFRDEYTWVSDLPWGWVTFHYGRWAYTVDRGWAWVAGRRYAGAWVDWRLPPSTDPNVVGWGPTPPAHLWRISPGARASRAHRLGQPDPRVAIIAAVPHVAFATPYTYARARDLFAPDLGWKLLDQGSALSVAHATIPTPPPAPERLGFRRADLPTPPMMDRGLQQAWALATPATADAIGYGPELGPRPRLRTWVAGGPRWAVVR